LGDYALSKILEAADSNPVHNKEHGDAGPMMVTNTPNHGGSYAIFVFLSGTNDLSKHRYGTRYFALQLNIEVANKDHEIQALLGLYGPRISGTLDEFDEMLEKACVHIRSWRLEEHYKVST
jgi:hypothetical protein